MRFLRTVGKSEGKKWEGFPALVGKGSPHKEDDKCTK